MKRRQQEVADAKAAAVASEDFALAQRCKALEARFAELAERDARRQILQQEAVFQQDFAAAGELNAEHLGMLARCDEDIRRLREGNTANSAVHPTPAAPGPNVPQRPAPGGAKSKKASAASASSLLIVGAVGVMVRR